MPAEGELKFEGLSLRMITESLCLGLSSGMFWKLYRLGSEPGWLGGRGGGRAAVGGERSA